MLKRIRDLLVIIVLFAKLLVFYFLYSLGINHFFPAFQKSCFFIPIFLLIVVCVYQFLKTKSSNFISIFFSDSEIDYNRFLKNFSTALMTIVDLKKLSDLVVNTLQSFYDLETACILLIDDKTKNYTIRCFGGDEPPVKFISEEDPFVDYLKEASCVLIKAKIKKDFLHSEIFASMDALKASLCIPLIFKRDLIGMLMLGRKRNGQEYSAKDEDAFFTIESQVSVAFNNAILFKAQQEAHILLAQKNKMDAIIALSSGINHEINNPLSIISMRCQNFLRKLSNGKFITASEVVNHGKEVIESSLRNANRAHLITKRLASFAKPVQEDMSLQPVFVIECIRECIDLIGKKQFFSDNITVDVDVSDTLAPVYADRVHFQQILYNMIMNAWHAIEKNGTITFKAYEKGSKKIIIEISDTGVGITDENLDKIWEPFFTTKPTNPLPGSKATGSGLGLSLVKRYIESSGGRIEVSSKLGYGTTFYLTLIKAIKKGDND